MWRRGWPVLALWFVPPFTNTVAKVKSPLINLASWRRWGTGLDNCHHLRMNGAACSTFCDIMYLKSWHFTSYKICHWVTCVLMIGIFLRAHTWSETGDYVRWQPMTTGMAWHMMVMIFSNSPAVRGFILFQGGFDKNDLDFPADPSGCQERVTWESKVGQCNVDCIYD